MTNVNEKNWAMAAHLSLLTGVIVPLAGIIAPIAIWMLKRSESKYIDQQGKEVVNFIICTTIVAVVLMAPLAAFYTYLFLQSPESFSLPYSLTALTTLLALVGALMPVVAAVKCSKGYDFRYPLIFRLIK